MAREESVEQEIGTSKGTAWVAWMEAWSGRTGEVWTVVMDGSQERLNKGSLDSGTLRRRSGRWFDRLGLGGDRRLGRMRRLRQGVARGGGIGQQATRRRIVRRAAGEHGEKQRLVRLRWDLTRDENWGGGIGWPEGLDRLIREP